MSERRPLSRGTNSRPVSFKNKYNNVSARVNTGKTAKDVEVLSNFLVAKRRSELFKRIRAATLVRFIEREPGSESVYNLPSEARPGTAVTMNTAALGLNDLSEFLVVDLRDAAEYRAFHIRDALSFSAPNIARDRFLPELYEARNRPNKFIVAYAWDERVGREAAQVFAEKGFDNVYLLSGGLQEFARTYPHLLEGTFSYTKAVPK